MNRISKLALRTFVLLGLAAGAGAVAGCGKTEDHSGHDHKDGDGHDHAAEKAK